MFSRSDWWKSLVFNILFILLTGLPAWGGWRRATREPENRWTWRLLSLGSFAGALGGCALLVSLLQSGVHVDTPPRKVFLLWNGAVLSNCIALFLFQIEGDRKRFSPRAVMDLVISALGCFLLIWAWFLEDLLAKSGLHWLDQGMVVAFFVIISGNLGMASHLISARKAAWNGPIGYLAGMCLALVVLLPPWVEAMLTQTYHQAHPARLMLLPAWVLAFFGFRAAWPQPQARRAGSGMEVQDMLPYLPVLAATGFVGFSYLRGGAVGHSAGWGLFLGLAILVMMRQFVTLRALHHLRRTLEDRVEERTRDLQDALVMSTAADEAKSTFLARMSHELKTPVNQMLLFLELLKAEWPGETPSSDIDAIRNAGRNLDGLITDLLTFSDLQTGRVKLNQESVELKALLDDLEHSFHPLAKAKGIALLREEGPGLPLAYEGDGARLHHVLAGLLENAIKFTVHGHALLRVGRVGPGHGLRFEVEDTGPGIPADLRPRVFDPFVQGDESLSRGHGGTGLGLAIAHGIVALMGGRIGLECPSGGGARFWFELP